MQRRMLFTTLFAAVTAAAVIVVACQGDDPEAVNPCANPLLCLDSGAPPDGSTASDSSTANDGTSGDGGDGGCTAPCNGDLVWLRSFGSGKPNDAVSQAVVDSAGNIYILANAQPLGLGDDGGAPLVEQVGWFVAKFDPDGKPLWAKSIGGTVPVMKLAVDATSNLFVAGTYYRNTTTDVASITWGGMDTGLGLNASSPASPTSNRWDMFVLKIDGSGGFVASTQIGVFEYERLDALSVDPDGSPIIFGATQTPIVYKINTTTTTIPVGAFVLKLSAADFSVKWVHPIPLKPGGNATGVEIVPLKDGELAVAGTYTGEVDFDGNGQFSSAGSTTDTFVARLHVDGGMGNLPEDFLSIYNSKAGSVTSVSAVAVYGGPVPSIGLIGPFQGWVGLGSQGQSLQVGDGGGLEPATYVGIFSATSLALLDHRGVFDGPLVGLAVDKFTALDKSGNITVAGTAKETVDYGGGPLASPNAGNTEDAVVVHYGTSLKQPKWAKRFGGPAIDRVAGMGVDPNGAIVVVGEFRATANFPGDRSITTKDGYPNVFLMKLAR